MQGQPHLFGFRTYIDQNTDGINLYLVFTGPDGIDTQIFTPVLLWSRSNATAHVGAECIRMKSVIDALCRYINTCGSKDDLEQSVFDFIDAVRHMTVTAAGGSFKLAYLNDTVESEALYTNEAGTKFIHVVPDQFSTELTPAEALAVVEGEPMEAYYDGPRSGYIDDDERPDSGYYAGFAGEYDDYEYTDGYGAASPVSTITVVEKPERGVIV